MVHSLRADHPDAAFVRVGCGHRHLWPGAPGDLPDTTLEREMAGKNKGGREVRKPKQTKAPKTNEITSAVAKAVSPKKK
jgi:hypothetical protein